MDSLSAEKTFDKWIVIADDYSVKSNSFMTKWDNKILTIHDEIDTLYDPLKSDWKCFRSF